VLVQAPGWPDDQAAVVLEDVGLFVPSGAAKWADLRFAKVPPRPGSPSRRPLVLVVFNDRTARVQAQQAQEQALDAERMRVRAEAAAAAKTQTLSRLSHELRTPLNAVLGFSQLLLRAEVLPPKSSRWVEHIRSAGEHLLSLVSEVLTINAAEAGALQLRTEQVPLRPLVSAALEMHEPLAIELDLQLTLAGPQQLSAFVDRQRTSEVLINLISNAVKYNRRGGRVEVCLDDGRPEDQAAGLVRVEVHDTGIGMNDLQLTHLFEPFNRLGVESSHVPGTGLGLSISQSVVEAMGGRLDVRSTGGAGSVFSLLLPAVHASKSRGVPSAPAPGPA
jgi:signal transduction histidine kinase